MAEESAVRDLERLVQQLQALFSRYSSDTLRARSEAFCSEFRTCVEEHAARWQVPLPQLRILEIALCYFSQASTFLPSNCDHVIHTLSSLALSVFELLLFFDHEDYNLDPLKQFTVTFQECHSALAKHQNVHLLQVVRLLQGGGMWAYPALQAILSDSNLPQHEVDGCITSEPPVFLELRVRYLLSHERVREAIALSRCCARHPTAGRHLFFLQVYLTSLFKTSQLERLHAEVAGFNGKEAVAIICNLECEENDDVLLSLSRVFLSEQLRRGDLQHLCDLVLVWTNLHNRLNTPTPPFLQESRRLMLSATNVNSIFPFIRAILQEVGEDGIQFCVELCANALQSFPSSDVTTKTLIYKTIAALVPNDLEVCRACALLVFFLERTVESYKTVYLLYMLPDQEYHVDCSSIGNQVRFETLQILKKDLYFDPEFWNLFALRTNCLKLMREKGVSTALDELMEDKWITKYCTKDSALRQTCKERKAATSAAAQKRPVKGDAVNPPKRFKVGLGKPRINVDYTGKKKGSQRPQMLRESSSVPLRRSFWQLDRIPDREHGRITRLSEKSPKRRIRKPRWLLEDSGVLEENRLKKHGLRCRKHHRSSGIKAHESDHKPSVNSEMNTIDISNTKHKRSSADPQRNPSPQVILELSLPDNELHGTFTDESCHRQRGFPQMLLYKPTEKVPDAPQPVRTAHRNEVVLRARDLNMFVQQLHCYIRRPKGKDNGSHVHGSVSTITRSSVQGAPPQDAVKTKAPREKSKIQLRGKVSPQTAAAVPDKEILYIKARDSVLEGLSPAKEPPEEPMETQASDVLKSIASEAETFEEPAVEMKVTIASQSPILDKVAKAEVLPSSKSEVNLRQPDDGIHPKCDQINVTCDTEASSSQQVSPKKEEDESPMLLCQAKCEQKPRELSSSVSEVVELEIPPKDPIADASLASEELTSTSCTPSLTDGTEVVSDVTPQQLLQEPEKLEKGFLGNGAFKDPPVKGKIESSPNEQTTSTHVELQMEASQRDVKQNEGKEQDVTHDPLEDYEFMEDQPESEESKLEYCCTFCNKDFKGCRVVQHAMFHYRKDECMFCGTMFKDDLLAMMHLSNHIEKLKKIKEKEALANDTKGKASTQTKELPAPKTVASPECRKRGRPRKLEDCPKSSSDDHSIISQSRKLRSFKAEEDVSPSQEQSSAKHRSSKTAIHKLNGHLDKKKETKKPRSDFNMPEQLSKQESHHERLEERQCSSLGSSSTSPQVDTHTTGSEEEERNTAKAPHVVKKCAKQNRTLDEKQDAPKEKVNCPVSGCSWFTDISKNRVALLYHALEDHTGETKPLELAFRIGKSRCSICMRVLWSFEHFQHHIERHRLTPRHPCLHQGCTARFKTGIEMRRHTRKHSPLQAVCCLPGCPKLFICLWALNLHEREHYASKSSKTNKNQNLQKCDEPAGTKKEVPAADDSKDPTDPTARQSQKVKNVKIPPSSAGDKKTDILKLNGPNPKLRKTLRSWTNDAQVLPSSLLLCGMRARHKLRKKQAERNTKDPKKRGRPRKVIDSVHVEHTATAAGEQSPSSKNQVNKLPQSDGTGGCWSTVGKCTADVQPSDPKTKKSFGKKDKSGQGTKKANSASDRSATNSNSGTQTEKANAAIFTRRSSDSPSPKLANGEVKKEIMKQKQNKKLVSTKSAKLKRTVDKAEPTAPRPSREGVSEVQGKGNENKESKQNTSSVPTHLTSAPPSSEKLHSIESELKVKKGRLQEGQETGLKCVHVKEQHEVGAETETAVCNRGQEAVSGSPARESSPSSPSVVQNAKTEPTKNCQKSSKQEICKKTKAVKTTDPCKVKKKRKERPEEETNAGKQPKKNSHPSATTEPTQTHLDAQPVCEDSPEATDSTKTQPADHSHVSAMAKHSKTKPQGQPVGEEKAEAAQGSAADPTPPLSTTDDDRDEVVTNGEAPSNAKPSVRMDILKEYSKKPYLRLPPTAYLAESYITMPKRRKEVSWVSPFQRSAPSASEQPHTSVSLQRRRCANCFTTFPSTEELQEHQETHKCSKLFGFDSDED